VLAADRDLGELQRSLGQRARELWAKAPRERHERIGLTSWDFDALPRSVDVDIDGRRLRAYPALVDAETTVNLRLLESPEAADEATRGGLRRLFLLQLRTTLAKLEAQVPGAIAQGPLAVPGTTMTPRRQIVLRALDEAFRLEDVPRSKAAFTERLAAGRSELDGALAELSQVAVDPGAELGNVRAALKPIAGKAGILRTAYDDIQSQLEHLISPELMRVTSHGRLGHIVRYLRALQIRLQRLSNDPAKDQQKAAQVAPFWQSFTKKRDELHAKGYLVAEIEEFGWLLEEFRVQTFAPELKTAVPVSAQRLQDQWTRFAR
jgi:ATP-dependent helicase HrpA